MKTPLDEPSSSLVDSIKTHLYRRPTIETLVPLLPAALTIEGNRTSEDALLTVPGTLMTVVTPAPTFIKRGRLSVRCDARLSSQLVNR